MNAQYIKIKQKRNNYIINNNLKLLIKKAILYNLS